MLDQYEREIPQQAKPIATIPIWGPFRDINYLTQSGLGVYKPLRYAKEHIVSKKVFLALQRGGGLGGGQGDFYPRNCDILDYFCE